MFRGSFLVAPLHGGDSRCVARLHRWHSRCDAPLHRQHSRCATACAQEQNGLSLPEWLFFFPSQRGQSHTGPESKERPVIPASPLAICPQRDPTPLPIVRFAWHICPHIQPSWRLCDRPGGSIQDLGIQKLAPYLLFSTKGTDFQLKKSLAQLPQSCFEGNSHI